MLAVRKPIEVLEKLRNVEESVTLTRGEARALIAYMLWIRTTPETAKGEPPQLEKRKAHKSYVGEPAYPLKYVLSRLRGTGYYNLFCEAVTAGAVHAVTVRNDVMIREEDLQLWLGTAQISLDLPKHFLLDATASSSDQSRAPSRKASRKQSVRC
jgi:hypothetical protein